MELHRVFISAVFVVVSFIYSSHSRPISYDPVLTVNSVRVSNATAPFYYIDQQSFNISCRPQDVFPIRTSLQLMGEKRIIKIKEEGVSITKKLILNETNNNTKVTCSLGEVDDDISGYIIKNTVGVVFYYNEPVTVLGLITEAPATTVSSGGEGKLEDSNPGKKKIWKVVAICVVVSVIVIVTFIFVYMKMKGSKTEDKILLNEPQPHSDVSYVEPVTVYDNYTNPKDINEYTVPRSDASETYMDPYVHKIPEYAQPIPKNQRAGKQQVAYTNVLAEMKYSNSKGKEYVNEVKKSGNLAGDYTNYMSVDDLYVNEENDTYMYSRIGT